MSDFRPRGTTRRRAWWLQALATLTLLGGGSGIGVIGVEALQPHSATSLGRAAGALAAPLSFLAVTALRPRGRRAAAWAMAGGALVYTVAGGIAGALQPQPWATRIPIMALFPLVFPALGAAFGALLHQAASQGYLSFSEK